MRGKINFDLWEEFHLVKFLLDKSSPASTSSRFSHLLRFPARGNNGSMIAHWLSLKSLAYLRRSFFCIMLFIIPHFSLLVQLLKSWLSGSAEAFPLPTPSCSFSPLSSYLTKIGPLLLHRPYFFDRLKRRAEPSAFHAMPDRTACLSRSRSFSLASALALASMSLMRFS